MSKNEKRWVVCTPVLPTVSTASDGRVILNVYHICKSGGGRGGACLYAELTKTKDK